MAFNVNQFRQQLTGDGARPNLFEVRLNFPSYVQGRSSAAIKSSFMVKTAQLPGSTLGSVPVNYFGREVKVAGNRTFADWTVTIINDEDFVIRNAMESWIRGINDNETNLRRALTSQQYASDAQVFQYSKAGGSPIKSYKFIGMFPIDLSPIELDWGSNDTIEEFSVTFQYQYWLANDREAAGGASAVAAGLGLVG
jgi:hypothetical protein